jgi:hypothetical protein
MYKNKDKQREANRRAQARFKAKGITQGITEQGNTNQLLANQVIPNMRRGKDIKCFADLPPDVQQSIDMMSVVDGKIDQTIKANRTAIAVNYQHIFPERYEPQDAVCSGIVIGKPGDADYTGVCTPEWRAERGR